MVRHGPLYPEIVKCFRDRETCAPTGQPEFTQLDVDVFVDQDQLDFG